MEYLLILALVALAAVAGMQSIASSISGAFSKIGAKLGQYVSEERPCQLALLGNLTLA